MIKISRPFLSPGQIKFLRQASGLNGPAVIQDNIRSFQLIWQLCRAIKFPIRTITTSMLVYQKAVMYNGNRYPFVELVVACVLVASKIEDTLKRTKELVTLAHKIRSNVSLTNSQADEAKSSVLGLERQILETIGFDFRIRHPHNYIVSICKQYAVTQEIAQMAWTIATDAYMTDSVLQYPSHVIAVASLWLAFKIKTSSEATFLELGKLYCTKQQVYDVYGDLLDFYIHYGPQSLLGKDVAGDVSMFMSLRMELLSNHVAPHEDLDPQDPTLTGLSIRNAKISDTGTVRYILEWERGHVKGEVLS